VGGGEPAGSLTGAFFYLVFFTKQHQRVNKNINFITGRKIILLSSVSVLVTFTSSLSEKNV